MMIDGRHFSGTSGEHIDVFNPSNRELVGRVPIASAEEIDSAVRSAYRAFGEWRETPPSTVALRC